MPDLRIPSVARGVLPISLMLLAASSCGGDASRGAPPPCPGESFEAAPLAIRCGVLVDALGREITLTGINARVEGIFDVTFDDGRVPLQPIPPFGADDARRMRELGFNALRLPINWSGIEPTEGGGFDEAYLDRVAAAVETAHSHGLLVLVDIHQDAYSKEIGEDGAPYWAIVPRPPERLEGPLEDLDARRLSKPVLDAFETFFGPSADGARLRQRFAAMAAHVAARFAGHPGVAGLELFNEPITTHDHLVAFHSEVLAAVRAVAPRMLVFFEPTATRNFLDRADIPDAPLGAGTVYAPHVYTAAFGDDAVRAAVTRDALERSYVNAREEADAWQTPLVVGELGFPPTAPTFTDYMRWHAELAESERASTFFWLWKENSQGSWGLFDHEPDGTWKERAIVIDALARVRLEACAGLVTRVDYDAARGVLEVHFHGLETTRENLVSFGVRHEVKRATCDGKSVEISIQEPSRIACGGPGAHVLGVEFERR
jgi:endoglycosylceramidase